MILSHKRKWFVEAYLLLIPTVNLQIPIYGIPQPQIYALPPPPPIAIPYPVPVLYKVKEKETTTKKSTTKPDVYVAVPVPVPAPYPVHVPVYPQPPPPPPAPVFPFAGYSVIRPPSYLMLPFPPKTLPRPYYVYSVECSSSDYESSSSRRSSSDSCDDDSSGSSSSSSTSSESSGYKIGKKYGHVLKRPRSRRNLQYSSDDGDSVDAKPILSYINKNGDVKMKQRLTKVEALQLMNKDKRTVARLTQIMPRRNTDYKERAPQEIKVVGEKDSENNHIKITSNVEMTKLASGQQSRSGQPVLSEGRKELIFRHPKDKRITNLSLSFQIN